MHYFDHTIDNRIQYLYFMRLLLLLKSPILAKSWCVSWAELQVLVDNFKENVICYGFLPGI